VYTCSTSLGYDAEHGNGSKAWSVDQIHNAYFDQLELKDSWPKDGPSAMSPAGCPIPQGTANRSRQARLTALNFSDSAHAPDVFFASKRASTSSLIPENVYAHNGALRLRYVGETTATTSDDHTFGFALSSTPPPDLPTDCYFTVNPIAAVGAACVAGSPPNDGTDVPPGRSVPYCVDESCLLAASCPTVSDTNSKQNTGAEVATKDFWGPGEYEFELNVPITQTANCLLDYTFSVYLETNQQIYTIFAPVMPGEDKPYGWTPSEQAPWSPRLYNTCDMDNIIPRTSNPFQKATLSGTTFPFWTAPSHGLQWYAVKEPQTCVPTGASTSEINAGANTYLLKACQSCKVDADCAVSDFKCKAVAPGAPLRCVYAGDDQAALAQYTQYVEALKALAEPHKSFQTLLDDECDVYDLAWQTGKAGSQWCTADSGKSGDDRVCDWTWGRPQR
jgi:hypothetical protein